MAQQTCPRCGMQQMEWKGNDGRGVTREGKTFCCEGCSNDTGCTCR